MSQNSQNKPVWLKKGHNGIRILPFSGSFRPVNSKCTQA